MSTLAKCAVMGILVYLGLAALLLAILGSNRRSDSDPETLQSGNNDATTTDSPRTVKSTRKRR